MSQWNSSFAFTFIIQLNRNNNFHVGTRHLTFCLITGWSGLSLTTTSRHVRASVVIAKPPPPSTAVTDLLSVVTKPRVFRESPLTGEVIKFERFRRRRSRLPTYCVFCAIRSAHFLGFVRADSCRENISLHSCLSFSLPSSHTTSISRASFCHLCVSECFFFYHFYWARTTVVIEVDRGLWTRGAIQ